MPNKCPKHVLSKTLTNCYQNGIREGRMSLMNTLYGDISEYI